MTTATLNAEQQSAIKHTGAPLVIYAGPGTGKTLVLQKKYEHLIKQNIPPHKILGITFTRSAAKELSERIANNCNIHPDHIVILTFHAFCLNILRRYSFYADLTPGFEIADPTEQDQIIFKALQDNSLPFTPKHVILIKQIISRVKKRQQSTTPANHIEEYALAIFNDYQATLQKQNKIDYDDIISKALTGLNVPAILDEYQHMFDYILLDEAQDTTMPQSDIIYQLKCPNTTIVGDQNQSIYSFAGANPNFMQEFQDKMNSATIHLRHNYRNPQVIIDAANTVIQHNENYINSQLIANKQSNRKIGILQTLNENSEAQLIANCIVHNNLKNVTILYRRNENAKIIEVALQQKVIPYEINGLHFHEKKEIQEAISIFRFLLNPTNTKLFRQILVARQGIGPATADRIIQHHQDTKEPLLVAAQQKLHRVTKEQHLTLKKLALSIDKASKQKTHDAIKTVIKETITQPQNKEQTQNLKTFRIMIQNRQETLKEIIDYIDSTASNPEVKLMTLHAAKGTENDTVFIIGTEEGLIPDENSFIDHKAVEEERRLFYVGLTRTKETLILSYARNRTINGLRLSQEPSRFLNEIPQKDYL